MRPVLALGMILCGLTAANAADLPLKAPPPPPPIYDWTGFYVGGFAGGSWVDGNLGPVGGPYTGFHTNGFVGGFFAGYDHELPNKFVIGARVSVPLGAVNESIADPFGPPGSTIKSTGQWGFAINGILGYDMGMWMPYVGVGGIFINNRVTRTIAGVGSASDTKTNSGVNVLTGIKYAVARHWDLGVQYNYSDFGRETYNFGPPLGVSGSGKFHQNSFVATVDYRF